MPGIFDPKKTYLRIPASVFKDRGTASAIFEISFVVACVLAAEWILPLFFGKKILPGAIAACLALLLIIVSQIARGESLQDLGFRIDNLGRALSLLVPAMVFASIVLIGIGLYCGSLRISEIAIDSRLYWTGLGLFTWGLIQQYPLQSFINRRAQSIFGPGKVSVIFVAAIFALLHLPNLWLMTATFFGGLLWAFVYQRAPNLWAVALSHTVMTTVLVVTVPYSSLHGLKVGYNYYW